MGSRGARVVLRALITAASLPSKLTTYGPGDREASDEGAQHVLAHSIRIGMGLNRLENGRRKHVRGTWAAHRCMMGNACGAATAL